jgi:hypothetical protein
MEHNARCTIEQLPTMSIIEKEKPKKFVLPRLYIRITKVVAFEESLEDNLEPEQPLITSIVSVIFPNDQSVTHVPDEQGTTTKRLRQRIKKAENGTTEKEIKRKPSNYNIFVKETLITLSRTHSHMTSKERFTLALMMWGEKKKQSIN